MKAFWDARYSEPAYAYGIEPNRFFREQLDQLAPGRLFLPGEGEGRNAVYAARQGWKVDALDWSCAAKEKALKLADEHAVELSYEVASFSDCKIAQGAYNACGVIFFHLPVTEMAHAVQRMAGGLAPGGTLFMELYSKEQLGRNSGGPQDEDLLYSMGDVHSWLNGLEMLLLEQREVMLDEGPCHTGLASVLRTVARKG